MNSFSHSTLVLISAILLFSCIRTQDTSERVRIYKEETKTKAHFRGIQAISESTVWLSGTDGTVLLTTDGGQNWINRSVPDNEGIDFRDIHALDVSRAWVMSSGNGVKIYYTSDGGETWKLQFEDKNPKVFMDGMDFSDENQGVVYGDPISGVMDVLLTDDGGITWTRVSKEELPQALEGEAGFAASGTGAVYKGETIWLATGGAKASRILKSEDKGESWKVYNTPVKGGEGAGVFSMAFKNELEGIVVGGNYLDSTSMKYNCAYTNDGGLNWSLVEKNNPLGYRSCVTFTASGTAIACGRTGIDISNNSTTWKSFSKEGFFTADSYGEVVWLAGRSGKVGRLDLSEL